MFYSNDIHTHRHTFGVFSLCLTHTTSSVTLLSLWSLFWQWLHRVQTGGNDHRMRVGVDCLPLHRTSLHKRDIKLLDTHTPSHKKMECCKWMRKSVKWRRRRRRRMLRVKWISCNISQQLHYTFNVHLALCISWWKSDRKRGNADASANVCEWERA